MTRVADTSFLIALFDGSDPRLEQARRWARDPEPIEVLPEVAGETFGVIHRRKGFAFAQKILDGLRAIPHLRFREDSDVAAVEEIFRESAGTLSWVDSAVVAAVRYRGHRPLCFDAAIERAAASKP